MVCQYISLETIIRNNLLNYNIHSIKRMGTVLCCQVQQTSRHSPMGCDKKASLFDSPAHLPYDQMTVIPFSEKDTHVTTLKDDNSKPN